MVMLDYITPSLDTTILAITNTIALFAEHPDQWDLLRADRSLIPHAINESLRLESPVPQFSRVLTDDHEIGGVALPAGARVALLYASANRDERHYPDPTRFDITRRPADHLAFGRGEHVCVGMHLARLEMGVLLERLADRVTRFHIRDSRPLINNGLRGLDSLEVTVDAVPDRERALTPREKHSNLCSNAGRVCPCHSTATSSSRSCGWSRSATTWPTPPPPAHPSRPNN
ncbi:cytochrome P450 [Nocardia jiangxiensis]|uniref:Cytochrome P450 n=2 Tax=Nocardia jiangxiensis TaxID=282685 RepID=A0ABW6RVR5_9NOCA